MRRGASFWVVVVLLPLLHFLLTVALGIGAWAPDLLLVGLLLAVRAMPVGWAAGLGLAYGILEDAFSVLAFGANGVAMTAVGILGARSRDLFIGESLLFLAGYLTLGKWLRDLLHWVVAGEAVREPFVSAILVQSPLAAIYAAVAGTLLAALTGIWREPVVS